jgi:hypothetical protein
MDNAVDLSGIRWRKSSRSGTNAQCVEIGFVWRKSSRSGTNANCVEIGRSPELIAVRDSKNPTGPVLTFSPTAFDHLAQTLHM